MVNLIVDGASYEIAEGRTLLQALDELGVLMNGVDIPHYCWHPKLSVDGSCRLCQVEIEGVPKLQIACDTPVVDGMVVHTKNERVRQAREGVMELLLINHPLDCPICDQAGECKLQDHAYDYGVPHARTREPRRPGRKRVDLGPTIVFDEERCILCRRCVRFCREIPETGELMVEGRGDRSRIATVPDQPLDNPYSMNVADVCPVGALTTKDFRFKARVWDLQTKPGICTGCSNGCNVHIGVHRGEVVRYTPRRNDAINETWLCDYGRLSYRQIGAPDRIAEFSCRDKKGSLLPASPEQAIGRAALLLSQAHQAGAETIAILASAHLTNEELSVLRDLADELGVSEVGLPVPTGEPDGLLLKAERCANASGARAVGFGDPEPVYARLRDGTVGCLLVLGHDALGPTQLASAGVLRSVESLILLDTHRSALEQVASVVMPGLHAAEKTGTLTNHEGVQQELEPARETRGPAVAEGDSLSRILARLRRSGDVVGGDG